MKAVLRQPIIIEHMANIQVYKFVGDLDDALQKDRKAPGSQTMIYGPAQGFGVDPNKKFIFDFSDGRIVQAFSANPPYELLVQEVEGDGSTTVRVLPLDEETWDLVTFSQRS